MSDCVRGACACVVCVCLYVCMCVCVCVCVCVRACVCLHVSVSLLHIHACMVVDAVVNNLFSYNILVYSFILTGKAVLYVVCVCVCR